MLGIVFGILGTIIGAIGTVISLIMNWRYQKLQSEAAAVDVRLRNIELQKTISSGIDPEITYESVNVEGRKFLIINLKLENISEFRYRVCGMDLILEVLPVSLATLKLNNKSLLELEIQYDQKNDKPILVKNEFLSEIIPELSVESMLSYYGPNRKKEFSIPVQVDGTGLFRVLMNRIESCLIDSIDHTKRNQLWTHGGDQIIGAIK
jgi:hypothetical protein